MKRGHYRRTDPSIGIIGNEIWSLYDIVLDPVSSSVWVKRNENQGYLRPIVGDAYGYW